MIKRFLFCFTILSVAVQITLDLIVTYIFADNIGEKILVERVQRFLRFARKTDVSDVLLQKSQVRIGGQVGIENRFVDRNGGIVLQIKRVLRAAAEQIA